MHRLAYTMTFYCNPDEYNPDEEQNEGGNEAENNDAAPEAEWGSQRPRSDGASHTTHGFLTAATGACTVPIDDALGCAALKVTKNTAPEATAGESMNENRTGAPHPHNTAKQDPK
jgi:hypothetical protein